METKFGETQPPGALMAKYAVPCVIPGLALTALYLASQEPILTLFGGRVNEETFHHFQGAFIYLQTLRRASTAISMVQEVPFGVVFALLLPLRFGSDGVLYSMPVSDLLTFLICVIAIRYTCQALDPGGANSPKLCEN